MSPYGDMFRVKTNRRRIIKHPAGKTSHVSQSAGRDREATRTRLIQAVGALLARHGFTAVGVNAVAKEAGVDKVLIYRYFGGLPQLIAAFGREGDFWPSIEELAGGDILECGRLPLEDRMVLMARNYLRAIRKRPLTQEILAWEMVERNKLTEELDSIRERTTLQLFELFGPPPGKVPDLAAVSAIIGASVNYLVTRSRTVRRFSGIDLDCEEGWSRLEQCFEAIIHGILSASGTSARK
jgi:AcrR family transcriptional regulator